MGTILEIEAFGRTGGSVGQRGRPASEVTKSVAAVELAAEYEIRALTPADHLSIAATWGSLTVHALARETGRFVRPWARSRGRPSRVRTGRRLEKAMLDPGGTAFLFGRGRDDDTRLAKGEAPTARSRRFAAAGSRRAANFGVRSRCLERRTGPGRLGAVASEPRPGSSRESPASERRTVGLTSGQSEQPAHRRSAERRAVTVGSGPSRDTGTSADLSTGSSSRRRAERVADRRGIALLRRSRGGWNFVQPRVPRSGGRVKTIVLCCRPRPRRARRSAFRPAVRPAPGSGETGPGSPAPAGLALGFLGRSYPAPGRGAAPADRRADP